MRIKFLLSGLLILAACQPESTMPAADGHAFIIDPQRITVSGLSSGAYMAGQFHLAHSTIVGGAALIAGGPYWCAGNSIQQAIGPCVKGGKIDLREIQSYLERAQANGNVDDPENLADDSVWIFHGTNDVAVDVTVTRAAQLFYSKWISDERLRYVDFVDVVHGMPTVDTGVPCGEFGEPYLNACDYDAAGALLNHLYEDLDPRRIADGELNAFDQTSFDDAELMESGFLYVPVACTNGEQCGIHVAFHGCRQSSEFVGEAFVRGAGFNEWAEANNLLVLYPQVRSSKILPLNPLGCWDWWGYTGDDYATKAGAQIAAVKSMLDRLAGDSL